MENVLKLALERIAHTDIKKENWYNTVLMIQTIARKAIEIDQNTNGEEVTNKLIHRNRELKLKLIEAKNRTGSYRFKLQQANDVIDKLKVYIKNNTLSEEEIQVGIETQAILDSVKPNRRF